MPKIVKPLTTKEVESAIQQARKTKKQKWLSDGNGLVLKIEATGNARYWLRYRHPTTQSQQYRELGELSATFGLAEARKAAAVEREIRHQGKDPNEVAAERLQAEEATKQARLAKIAADKARIGVSELFERWVLTDLTRHKDGGKEIRRMFEKDVLPKIGNLAVEDVRKGHITEITDTLLTRGVPRMAKVIFSLIRQMFRFAVDRDIIENEPTASIRKARIGGKTTERDRVLGEDEIRALHQQIPAAELIKSTETAIWLSLATCCRIGELLRAEWQHIRLDDREWFIPSENSKNGKPHLIHLSDFALSHFKTLQTLNTGSKWCFPNKNDTEHVSDKTVTKQVGDRQRGNNAPMSRRSPHTNSLILRGGKWTPHDLRRTGATMMTALGVLPEVAEKCLNHTEESRVKRTYQRHSYEAEKRAAWLLLGGRLELLTHEKY